MKRPSTFLILAMVASLPGLVFGRLTLATNLEPQRIFFGHAKSVSVVIQNPGDQSFAGELRTRIFQTSTASGVLLSDNSWRLFQIQAGETVLSSATLDFPTVKAETRFIVQWLTNTNFVIGETVVLVYPTNLLAELKPLLGEEILGVLDPNSELAPLLKQNGVKFVDLGQAALEDFSGRLAILGPFHSKAQMPNADELARQIKALARRNAAVVWLLPPADRQDKLLPSFYTVMEGTNAVVIAQADMFSKLSENPQSQLDLIRLCKLALKPESFDLPHLTTQP